MPHIITEHRIDLLTWINYATSKLKRRK